MPKASPPSTDVNSAESIRRFFDARHASGKQTYVPLDQTDPATVGAVANSVTPQTIQENIQRGMGQSMGGPGPQGVNAVNFGDPNALQGGGFVQGAYDVGKSAGQAMQQPHNAGALVGGLIGGVGGPLASAAGAGIGAAAGTAYEDWSAGRAIDAQKAGWAGIENAGAQLAGGAIVAGGAKLLGAAAGKVVPFAEETRQWWRTAVGGMPKVAQELIDEGHNPKIVAQIASDPFTIGETSQGLIPSLIESSARAGVTGYPSMKEMGKVRNAFVDKVSQKIFRVAKHMNKGKLIKLMARGANDIYTNADALWDSTYKKIFDTATVGRERASTALVKRAQKVTSAWIKDVGGPKAVKIGAGVIDTELQDAVTALSANPTIASLHRWGRVLGKRVFANGDAETRARFGPVYDAVNTSIERVLQRWDKTNGTTFTDEFVAARRNIKDLNDVFNSGAMGSLKRAWAQRMEGGKVIKPGTILDEIHDPDELQQILGIFGKSSPEWKGMQAEMLFRLFNKARSGASKVFNANSLETELKGLTPGAHPAESYKAVLSPLQMRNAKMMGRAFDMIQQIQDLSPIAQVTQFGLLLGGGRAGLGAESAMLVTWPWLASAAAQSPGLGNILASLAKAAAAGNTPKRQLLNGVVGRLTRAGQKWSGYTHDPDMKLRPPTAEESSAIEQEPLQHIPNLNSR